WTSVNGADSYLLVMFDQDAYIYDGPFTIVTTDPEEQDPDDEFDFNAGYFAHWIVKDIPSNITSIPEGASGKENMVGVELENGFGDIGYGGPKPPTQHT